LNPTKEPRLPKQFKKLAIEYDELVQRNGLIDPIGDNYSSVGDGIIHRYECRALLLVTNKCSRVCRFCFRKNLLNEDHFDLDRALNYLNQHTELSEVILSGGDPFTLSSKKLGHILSEISHIKHIKFIRIHTRVFTISPQIINEEMLQKISEFSDKLTIVLHINELEELTGAALNLIVKLKEMGVNLLSQTVLLKGINDSSEYLTKLFLQIHYSGIRPYYLHHPDKVKGAMHFYLDEDQGVSLYKILKQKLPGWLLPHYAVDTAKEKVRLNDSGLFH